MRLLQSRAFWELIGATLFLCREKISLSPKTPPGCRCNLLIGLFLHSLLGYKIFTFGVILILPRWVGEMSKVFVFHLFSLEFSSHSSGPPLSPLLSLN